MASGKGFGYLAGVVVCFLVLAAGCTPTAEEGPRLQAGPEQQILKPTTAIEPAELSLKLTEGGSATYKVIKQTKRSVEFEGPSSKDVAMRGGHNDERIEMTFSREIQDVDEEGNGIVKIVIKNIKYMSMIRDKKVLDFDSTTEKDRDTSLARLIGQSYMIQTTPLSLISTVLDVKDALAVVSGKTVADRAASRLLSSDTIVELHGALTLPAAEKKRLFVGESWSDAKSFSFDFMGSKSFEKVYTVKEIQETDSQQIAVIDMNGIPTAALVDQPDPTQPESDFAKMFGNTATYAGKLKFNVTAGEVEGYSEELRSEWVAVDPSTQAAGKEPDVLTMRAIRLYSLEKVN